MNEAHEILAALEENLLKAREDAIWATFRENPGALTWGEVLTAVAHKTGTAEYGKVDARLRQLVSEGRLRLSDTNRLCVGAGRER